MIHPFRLSAFAVLLLCVAAVAQAARPIDRYDVVWDTPSEGRRILLLPAWPEDWDCQFKLHSPLETTLAGTVRPGRS